jgi:uncharacterized RDD family membrane protein YckC
VAAPLPSATDANVRALVTPEGVDLRVRLATVGERGIALMIDLTFILGTLLLLTIAAASVIIENNSAIAEIIWLLGFFILRNFYFTIFESGRRAATPGKRIIGLRVVARDGAALTTDAVVARNAMRELELYMPLVFLIWQGEDGGDLMWLAGVVWCGIFVLMPFFNRDRLRAGDLIAGTWVLKAPKQVLLPDLTGERPAIADAIFAFTPAHLDAYGVKELQVLETVLRQAEPKSIAAVAEQIRTKIAWTPRTNEDDLEFLKAYYASLRRRLEQRLLFGKRKRDKFDRE